MQSHSAALGVRTSICEFWGDTVQPTTTLTGVSGQRSVSPAFQRCGGPLSSHIIHLGDVKMTAALDQILPHVYFWASSHVNLHCSLYLEPKEAPVVCSLRFSEAPCMEVSVTQVRKFWGAAVSFLVGLGDRIPWKCLAVLWARVYSERCQSWPKSVEEEQTSLAKPLHHVKLFLVFMMLNFPPFGAYGQ